MSFSNWLDLPRNVRKNPRKLYEYMVEEVTKLTTPSSSEGAGDTPVANPEQTQE